VEDDPRLLTQAMRIFKRGEVPRTEELGPEDL
jgi:hypothetical protein